MSSWPKLADIAIRVQKGEATATDLVDQALTAIEANTDFKAIISVCESAKDKARQIDQKVSSGELAGRLAGVPFIAKDNFLYEETTAASNILAGFKAPYRATAIARLEDEGAICVAKANLDAFAHGSSTENSDFFVTKNPHDQTRVAGGSSGGSAAAVALEMAPFALGTDTGGSVRLPAAFCGTIGYKPTYGLVSRSGVIAMTSSIDVIGPITTNTKDAGLILDIISGKDELDSTTIDKDAKGYDDLEKTDFGKLRIGIIKEYMDEGVEPGVIKATQNAIAKLKKAGAKMQEVSLEHIELALAVYYIITPAEVSSNLSRYDGQRFGYFSKNAKTLEESYSLARGEGFGAEAKRRIMMGTYVLSSGYYEAYYKKAQLVRTKIINQFNEAFKNYDLLVGPTAPTTAFKIGEKTKDPLSMYLSDILTVGANIAGLPAVSLPAGQSSGLPVGFQMIAQAGEDRALLAAARSFESL
ncbi:MAG: Asp-tRNA(Asn)/Glu-tRNA(Gln) amidotransferase subunit GatA [Candidatus Saccharimonadales bacterium]